MSAHRAAWRATFTQTRQTSRLQNNASARSKEQPQLWNTSLYFTVFSIASHYRPLSFLLNNAKGKKNKNFFKKKGPTKHKK